MKQLTTRHSVLSLGLLVVAAGFGQACGAGSNSSVIDADGDKVADDLNAVTLDLDKDGKPDTLDLNGDGKFQTGLDTDGDGVLDAEGLDTNNDGIIDAIDYDGDGKPDKTSSLGGTGGSGNTGGGLNLGSGGGTGGDVIDNPKTCAEAAANRTYVGCEFWPTVTYNPVYTDFDFAVVLANAGNEDAEVTVTGPNSTNITETVPKGGLKAILLPWVAALKGPEFSRTNTTNGRADASVLAAASAYQVKSTIPVTAWQFNPLQYKKPIGEISGGCGTQFGTTDCFSASNDASLLIPTTAMRGSYRVFGRSEIQASNGGYNSTPGGMAITSTADGTKVKVQLGPNCKTGMSDVCIAAGTGVTAANKSAVVEYTLNKGDVLQLLGKAGGFDGDAHADISGSVIIADKPVQVISFNPITNVPNAATANADHIEELVLPGEALGKEYIVAPPTSPNGAAKGSHIVRFYGNVDGTNLTYENKPTGAPDTLTAGQVVEVAVPSGSFKVTGTQAFAVGSFMQGGAVQGDGSCPNYPCSGDPAFSMPVAPAQFRTQYTFLAPADYDKNYADVLVPDGATVTIDGAPVTASEAVVTGWKLARVALSSDGGGSHFLESDLPVGLQVMGFGHATSYYYPGGLNLKLISEPPKIY